MRIITANLNGIRAAERKGFFPWLARQRADVVCIQETKAQIDQLTAAAFKPKAFHCYYHDAEKKGYSGTALYSRIEPKRVLQGIGIPKIDREGRYLEAQFGNLSVVSLYMPSGTSGDERQDFKYWMMDQFMPHLIAMKKRKRDVIICGDWNIAHHERDIRNWKGNKKNSGFLPEERQWLTQLFEEVGYVDAFRELPQKDHEYTWWSNRGASFEKNVGWRIDYQITSPGLKGKVTRTRIYREKRFSDHAPLIIDYDFSIDN